MSGFIEFCVELKSASEGGAAAGMDGEVSQSQQPAGQEGSKKNGRGGRRGMLSRQNSVVCNRVHSLNTISYVDNGEFKGYVNTYVVIFLERAGSNLTIFVFQEKKSSAWSRKELRPSSPDRRLHPRTRLCKWRRVWSRVNPPLSSAPRRSETKPEHFTLRFKDSRHLTDNIWTRKGPSEGSKCEWQYLSFLKLCILRRVQ